MKYKFFNVPIFGSEAAEDELNRFLSSHRVVSVEKKFTKEGLRGCWCFCIHYLESRPNSTEGTDVQSRVDYKEVLNDQDFQKYARLRELRNARAKEEGRPAYSIFTNEQLANMVTQKVVTQEAMARIPGIGQARMEKYGPAFLSILRQLHGQTAG
ncbi:HRDC domain-containing protein [Desulfobacter postgatei]|uniref:HRDC domain-containing protein n=1 Tax=Desulfobacter postgatei TaxID=2293 RepID=UPI000232B845|nr:HRDC domain-containing protein [Desulfobacter postgatei]